MLFGLPLAGHARPNLALMGRLLTIGRHIFVRTTALMASFVVVGAVAARLGDASLGAHQIAFQLWVFIALVLDSIAIAGQVIVGRTLGAGRSDEAYAASARMIWLSVALGGAFAAAMLLLADIVPRIFTGDSATLAQAAALWPLFALMQPLNGAVFALDGILIGASDGRYLMWSMLAAFASCTAVALLALAGRLGDRRCLGGARRAHPRAAGDARPALPPAPLARHRLGLTSLLLRRALPPPRSGLRRLGGAAGDGRPRRQELRP